MSFLERKIIVFEGPDDVGKTTLSLSLLNSFRCLGIEAELFSFPGKNCSQLGDLVYNLHSDASAGYFAVEALSLQMLHVAAHVDLIKTKISTAYNEGKCIILDRFWWSTVIYGRATGVEESMLNVLIDLEKHVWNEKQPHAVFLLRRELSRGDAFNQHLVHEYEQMAEQEKTKYPVFCIDNLEIENTLQEISQKLHCVKG